jgi:hypothetical protein
MMTMGMTVEEMKAYYDAFLREYYGVEDEAILQRYAGLRKLHGMVKLLYGMCKTDRLPQEVKEQHIPAMRAGLMQILDAMGL